MIVPYSLMALRYVSRLTSCKSPYTTLRTSIPGVFTKKQPSQLLQNNGLSYFRVSAVNAAPRSEKRRVNENPHSANVKQEQCHEIRAQSQFDHDPQPTRYTRSQNTSSETSAIIWPSGGDFEDSFYDLSAGIADFNKCPYAFGEDGESAVSVRSFRRRLAASRPLNVASPQVAGKRCYYCFDYRTGEGQTLFVPYGGTCPTCRNVITVPKNGWSPWSRGREVT